MCGIVGVIGFDKAQKISIDITKSQASRGRDATGIAWISGTKIHSIKRAMSPEMFFRENMEKIALASSRMAVSHNRAATCNYPQKDMDKECHPFYSEDGTFVLMQNGCVANHEQLTTYLEAVGHKFSSGIDSEVLLHMLEDVIKASKTREEAMKRFYNVAVGNVLVMFNDGDLWGYNNTSAFYFVNTGKGCMIASELDAILEGYGISKVEDDVDIYIPDKEEFINVKLTDDGYNIVYYGKWNKNKLKSGTWVFNKTCMCDFCHTSGVACEKFENKDRCLKCHDAKITKAKEWQSSQVQGYYNNGRNIPRNVIGELPDKTGTTNDTRKQPTFAICNHCRLVHEQLDVITCSKCGKHFCMHCFKSHKCGEETSTVTRYMPWLDTLSHRKRNIDSGNIRGNAS